MKKSVVILIALIYVASIALVGFIGLRPKTDNDNIYVQSIKIENEYKLDSQGAKCIIFQPENDERSIQIKCSVVPENASDTKILYYLSPDCTVATITEDGTLTFLVDEVVSATVYIYSNQQKSIKDELMVFLVP